MRKSSSFNRCALKRGASITNYVIVACGSSTPGSLYQATASPSRLHLIHTASAAPPQNAGQWVQDDLIVSVSGTDETSNT